MFNGFREFTRFERFAVFAGDVLNRCTPEPLNQTF